MSPLSMPIDMLSSTLSPVQKEGQKVQSPWPVSLFDGGLHDALGKQRCHRPLRRPCGQR